MNEKFLIVSDVDGTLLGDERAVNRFAEWLAPRRAQFRVAYNSGRFPDSLRKSIEKSALPEPDVLIGGVGTQIEWFANGEPLEGWPEFQGYWDAEVVRAVLANESRLRLQPERFLSDYKVSYFVDNAAEAELLEWQTRLAGAGLVAQHVYSSRRDLDILPAGIDKGTAAGFLAKFWSFPKNRVIACGDTANDLALFEQGFLGIVVGNALEELKALDEPWIYHAQEHFAAGVQEGLQHWLERIKARSTSSIARSAKSA